MTPPAGAPGSGTSSSGEGATPKGEAPPASRAAAVVAAESALVFAAAALVAAFYLRATPARLAGAIAPDPGDPFFVLYVLRWVSHQLAEGLPAFWNANVFYPLEGALGLSDHLVGPAALFGLLGWLGASPAASFGLLQLASFGLAALSAFDVTRRLGYSRFAAAVVGFATAFSHHRWASLPQLHVLLAATVPWTLYLFDRLLVAPTGRRAALFLALYAANLAGGVYLGYAQHLALLAILALRAPRVVAHLRRLPSAALLAGVGVAAAALAAAAFLPYVRFRELHGVVTPVGWLSPLRVTLGSFFQVSRRSGAAHLLGPDSVLVGDAAALWIGLVPAALLVVGVVRRLRAPVEPLPAARWRRPAFFVALVLIAAALALGDWITLHTELVDATSARPWLRLYRRAGWIALAASILALATLPARARRFFARDDAQPAFAAAALLALFAALPIGFFLLRNFLPGYGVLRVTARIAALATPFLMLFVAEGASALAAWTRIGARRALAVVAFALLVVEGHPLTRTVRWVPAPPESRFPGYARWIAEHPEARVILELPFRLDWREAERMYFSTLHWRPLVNGYSSYIPPATLQLLGPARRLPDSGALAGISRRGVTHVVVHLDEVPRRSFVESAWNRAESAAGRHRPEVRRVYSDRTTAIYELLPRGAPPEHELESSE